MDYCVLFLIFVFSGILFMFANIAASEDMVSDWFPPAVFFLLLFTNLSLWLVAGVDAYSPHDHNVLITEVVTVNSIDVAIFNDGDIVNMNEKLHKDLDDKQEVYKVTEKPGILFCKTGAIYTDDITKFKHPKGESVDELP